MRVGLYCTYPSRSTIQICHICLKEMTFHNCNNTPCYISQYTFNFMWKILQYEHTKCWVHLYIVGSIQMGNMPEWTLREVSWNISSRSNATSHFDSLAVVHLHVWIDYLFPFLTIMHWTLESYFLFHSHFTFTLTSSLSFKNHSSD